MLITHNKERDKRDGAEPYKSVGRAVGKSDTMLPPPCYPC